jgi:hypothetical protein
VRLSSQNLPEIENVSEADIDRVFDSGAIGKFVHLWASDDCFIQAGSRGTPSNCVPPDDPEVKDHWAFIHRTGSEPWTLELIDLVRVREYQAEGDLTLGQVKRVFVEYLRGDQSWRQEYSWVEVKQGSSRTPVVAMTESDWLSCTQSTKMLGLLQSKASDRQLRLFVIACCRRIWPHIVDERSRRAVDLAELDVDGRLGDDERVGAARAAADALAEAFDKLDNRSNGHLYHAAWTAALCLYTAHIPLRTPVDNPAILDAFDCAMLAAVNSACAAAISKVHAIDSKIEKHARLAAETDAESARQCHLIRDIFGYPFEPGKTSSGG